MNWFCSFLLSFYNKQGREWYLTDYDETDLICIYFQLKWLNVFPAEKKVCVCVCFSQKRDNNIRLDLRLYIGTLYSIRFETRH